jgi:threonine/homoserine/homoserine lactone efflux protein
VIPVLPGWEVLAPFSLAVVVISLTPGPDMAFFVGRALTAGRAAGTAALAGALTGILIHTLAVALGLSALIVAAPRAFLALKLAGAAYLLWLAVQALRNRPSLALQRGGGQRAGLAATWASGLAINLLNPKIVLFFMTFLPQFVSASDPQAQGKLVALGLCFIVVAGSICLPMVLMADRFATLLRADSRIGRIIDWLQAGIFSAFAVQILLGRAR